MCYNKYINKEVSIIRQRKVKKFVSNDTPKNAYSESVGLEYNDFAKLRVGAKSLDDAIVSLGALKKTNRSMSDRERILSAIDNRDYAYLREVSDFFYETSGVYSRLVRYLAYLYRYDWMITPYISTSKTTNSDKILTTFSKSLNYLDSMQLKKYFGEVAIKVVKNGLYYGYLIDNDVTGAVQELPIDYCRSRYTINNTKPVVEFDVKFFDDKFQNAQQKINVVKSFPKEIAKGYIAFKEGRLKQEGGENRPWITLDPNYTCRFSLNETGIPFLASVIPAILDLDEAKELDKKKRMQELLKIVIQKLPLDKQGELIFDLDEATDLHNNAVQMLGKAVGVDVLTTFADIEVANMADKGTVGTTDELQKVERGIFNEAGVSQMIFATDGNLALDKSVSNDEATMYSLLLQYEGFMNNILDLKFNANPKKVFFRANMLITTVYNFKDIAKLYKEQATLGYSKLLPQIALGQSQSSILATAHFENEILDLANLMVPLQSSNTQSGDAEKKTSEKEGGRPEKEDGDKTDKTIQNKESMN